MPVSPYTPNTDAPRQPKLLERMRIHLRTQHYSIRTEQAYVDWARRFILFHKKWHPQEMGCLRGRGFLELSGRGAAGISLHAKPSQGGTFVSVQASARCRPALAR